MRTQDLERGIMEWTHSEHLIHKFNRLVSEHQSLRPPEQGIVVGFHAGADATGWTPSCGWQSMEERLWHEDIISILAHVPAAEMLQTAIALGIALGYTRLPHLHLLSGAAHEFLCAALSPARLTVAG